MEIRGNLLALDSAVYSTGRTEYIFINPCPGRERLEAYYKKRDAEHYEDKDIADRIKTIEKELALLKANI